MCAQVVVCVCPLLQIIVIVSPLIKLTRVKGAAIDDIGSPEGILNRCAVLCCVMRGACMCCVGCAGLFCSKQQHASRVSHHIIGEELGCPAALCVCRDHPVCNTSSR